MKWLDAWNAGRPYAAQVRPFGFMLTYMARTGVFAELPEPEITERPGRGRPRKAATPKPVAPYNSDPARPLASVFDRETGEPVRPEQLKTYAEALVQYHLSPDDKFENGQFLDRGRTERRHVVATGIVLIGKEANHVGESGEEHPLCPPVTRFHKLEFGA